MFKTIKEFFRAQRRELLAIAAFTQACRLHSNGQYEEAVAGYLKFREQFPENSEGLTSLLVQALGALERYDAARYLISEDLEREPTDPELNKLMVQTICDAGGDPDEYRPYLETYWANRMEQVEEAKAEKIFSFIFGKRAAHNKKMQERRDFQQKWDQWTAEMIEYYRKMDA